MVLYPGGPAVPVCSAVPTDPTYPYIGVTVGVRPLRTMSDEPYECTAFLSMFSTAASLDEVAVMTVNAIAVLTDDSFVIPNWANCPGMTVHHDSLAHTEANPIYLRGRVAINYLLTYQPN